MRKFTHKQKSYIVILLIILLAGLLRFVPVNSKWKPCRSGDFHIIYGELDDYIDASKPMPSELTKAMGLCADKKPIRLFVL